MKKFFIITIVLSLQITNGFSQVYINGTTETLKGRLLQISLEIAQKTLDTLNSRFTNNILFQEKIGSIRKKIDLAKKTINSMTDYPYYLNTEFNNYIKSLQFTNKSNNSDSINLILNFLEKGLSTKIVKGAPMNGENEFYAVDPKEVHVIVKDPNGNILNGFEVSSRIYYVPGESTRFNFRNVTDQAIELVTPGWYMFKVKKGKVEKEKEFKVTVIDKEPVVMIIPIE